MPLAEQSKAQGIPSDAADHWRAQANAATESAWQSTTCLARGTLKPTNGSREATI